VGEAEGQLTAAFGDSDPTEFRFTDGLTFMRGNSLLTFELEAGRVTRVLLDQISGLYVLLPERS
jgi:hypothetical protein